MDTNIENEVAEAKRKSEAAAKEYNRTHGIDPVGYLMQEGFGAEQLEKLTVMFDITLAEIAEMYHRADGETRREMLAQYRTEDAEERKSDSAPNDILASLGAYTIGSLTEAERRPPEFLVDRLVPVGLTFLSGAPKTRKSFMALQIAAAVASGTEFLGFKTRRCDVVYFDLEGSKSRTAARSERMSAAIPENVYVINRTDLKLADGLADAIRALHAERESIRLFIIDTYSRARGAVKTTGANAYDADVAFLEPLQRMATDENIAILCVHHDKKGAGAVQDSFERLSGTMGISGSCDCVLNLVAEGKRFEGRARFEYSPRDAKCGEMDLQFDDLTCEWKPDIFSKPELLGNPVIAYCVDHAPAKGTNGYFISYADLYKQAYKISIDRPSDEITKVIKEHAAQLYEEYHIGIQLGVKSDNVRGIRVVRIT